MQVFLAFVLLALASATQWHQLGDYSFHDFVQEFRPEYYEHEVEFRRNLVEQRLDQIRRHNQDTTKTWKLGVNRFTDKTDAELKAFVGSRPGAKPNVQKSQAYSPEQIAKFEATNVDWRQQNVVTAVKDQGRCGSCWSFAAAETLESYHAIAHQQLAVLSEQQILDCTPNPQHCGGTGGCGGGTVELAYAQIKVTGGLASEWTYPYNSYYGDANQCNVSRIKPVAKVVSYVNLPPNEYAPVIAQLATGGPLAISVDASSWFQYESGVYNGCNQTNPDLDHAVQLVGYGTDSTLGDYWLVRNSWSPTWGEQGYIRLARSSTVTCGTDLTPDDGDGCTGGPPTETVCGTCGVLYDAVYPVVK
jgi:cathepsin L